eukprot:2754584-Prymnesium_polylepis.1
MAKAPSSAVAKGQARTWSRAVVTASRWWAHAAAVTDGGCMRSRSPMALAAQWRRRRRRAAAAHRTRS